MDNRIDELRSHLEEIARGHLVAAGFETSSPDPRVAWTAFKAFARASISRPKTITIGYEAYQSGRSRSHALAVIRAQRRSGERHRVARRLRVVTPSSRFAGRCCRPELVVGRAPHVKYLVPGSRSRPHFSRMPRSRCVDLGRFQRLNVDLRESTGGYRLGTAAPCPRLGTRYARAPASTTPARSTGVRAALDHLWSTIIHQGTPWTATAPAALVVADFLDDPIIDSVWESWFGNPLECSRRRESRTIENPAGSCATATVVPFLLVDPTRQSDLAVASHPEGAW
jgi:hypothetical protein